MADRAELRAAAERKKAEARQKAEAAKRQAQDAKALRANPVPQYAQMPEPTGDAEIDSAADLDAVQSGFRARAADEARRFALATDSEYWGAICFQTREQRDAFFAAIKCLDLVVDARYFDGCEIARRMGISLPGANVPYRAEPKLDPVLVELVKE